METEEWQSAESTKAPFGERVTTWWLTRPWTVRLYLAGGSCMLVSIALFLKTPNSPSSDVATYASCALLVSAFLGDAYAWVVARLPHPLMKLATAVFGAIALATATGVARVVVNEATGQQASHFPTSSALLSLLSLVPVIAATTTILGAIPALLGMAWGFHKLSRSKATGGQLDVIITLIRGFSAFVVLIGASTLSSSNSVIYPAMQWVAVHSAFFFDLQEDDACAPLEGDRVSRINDDLVVIGRLTDSGPQFVRRACALLPETTPLRAQLPGRSSAAPNSASRVPTAPLEGPHAALRILSENDSH
ncbi:hypothetical protein [Stenotrophomonas maltophilia]|uniref:hypothetical protein n=1 Tax=Stenotrophomonas maltophilia TaxID=40324 RepID=UPI003878412E